MLPFNAARSFRIRLAFGGALALAASCGGDAATRPKPTASGTYVMRTVNGSRLPFVLGLDATGRAIIVDADTLVLLPPPGSTYREISYYEGDLGNDVQRWTESETGTYVFAADSGIVTFTPAAQGSVPYKGAVTDSTLTQAGGRFTVVYARR